ncbi:MAG: hypothetical protein MUP16_06730, partial [Sedimentisphaerales bacterium]|nr:hypothetical protein [Sedimentisphaerales bacterium]
MKIRYIVVVLVLASAGFSKAASEETEYFAVFMDGKKVGHAIHSRVEADGKVTSSEKVSITLSRANVPVTISMTETGIETVDGKPVGFEVIQDLGIMSMKSAGTVDPNGTVNVTTKMMGNEQKSTMQWLAGAVMTEGLEQLSRKQGLKEGTTYKAQIFSPSIMQAFDANVIIGPKQTVDLLGRVVTLTEVKTSYNMPGAGQIISTSFVDDDYKVQKNITPIVGMQVEMIACPKEFALGQNDVFEVIDKLLLASPQSLGDVNSAKSIV